MSSEETERYFLWTDADGITAKDNLSVKGFIAAINYLFYDETYVKGTVSLSHTPLYDQLKKITTHTAIQNDLYSEAVLDALADERKIPAWEYVGKYNVVTTVRDLKNNVLKTASDLLRHAGTPYSVAKILRDVGYTSVIIHENINLPTRYDGTWKYNGLRDYSGNLLYQLFNVELTSPTDITGGADDEQLESIVALVNAYKKERPYLYQLIIHEPSNPGGVTEQIWMG